MGEPALITGTVYRSSDGNALGGAQVKLFLVSQYPTVVLQTAITDSNGQFRFTGLIAPESYLVEYSFPVGAPAQATRIVDLQPGGEPDISIPKIMLTTG